MTISFDKKLAELDAYLQMLIDQSDTLDKKIDLANSEPERDGLKSIKGNLENLLASIKHAIVLLQIAKVSIRSDSSADSITSSSSSRGAIKTNNNRSPRSSGFQLQQQKQQQQQPQLQQQPEISPQPPARAARKGQQQHHHRPSQLIGSDLDDDDDMFYDAADDQNHQPDGAQNNNNIVTAVESTIIESTINNNSTAAIETEEKEEEEATMPNNSNRNDKISSSNSQQQQPQPIEDTSIDWDSLYEEEEEDLGSLENHGSVIRHLLSQIRIGMDLTKVVLPTFILERRSLLEMYADFFAHPDLFSSIPDYETPEERMVQLVRWYLSAFHAGRKSSLAKKPYNPILGEIFLCHWNLNNNDNNDRRSPEFISEEQNIENGRESDEPSVSDIERFSKRLPKGSLLFVAEQVSHHPPVSAFYAENPDKEISCCAHIYTKSKYLGLSVGVHNVGQGIINVLKHNETYVCTFPSAYGRSILTVPWVELGGSVNITCKETGYSADIEFVTKPFYGGRKHRVTGEIARPNKEVFMTIDGEWNGCMTFKSPPDSRESKVLVDTTCLPVINKHVRSISCQQSFESRNVWKEVTRALKLHDVNSATAAKSFIEQRQRDQLKERTEKGVKWKSRYFEQVDEDSWSYAKPLAERLREN